ncbi:MAG: nucleotidyltransferase domain-containing protein [Polyangia bacterium]
MSFTEHMARLPRPVADAIEEVVARDEVDLVLLFGSRARGEHGPMSDVDLAMRTTENVEDTYGWKFAALARLAGPLQDVDLVLLEEASLALRYRIARDGLPLWTRDEDALHAFCFEAVRDWLDFEPVVRAHDAALARRIADGTFGKGAPRDG